MGGRGIFRKMVSGSEPGITVGTMSLSASVTPRREGTITPASADDCEGSMER